MVKRIGKLVTEFALDRPIKKGSIINNRYKILDVVGLGGYGITYRVYDQDLQDVCALKQLRPSRSRRGRGRNSFYYETTILKEIHHPNIPALRDCFKMNHHYFWAMDYIKGKTFEDLIFREGKVYSERDSFQILYRLLHIVAYLHNKNIVHRDLRIPNIIMNNKDIYMIDFGLARYIDLDDKTKDDHHYFMEKRLRREVSFKSDFYALGHFVLFLLYSGYTPEMKIERSWEEELKITESARMIIRRLLQIDVPYENIHELRNDIFLFVQNKE